MSFGGVMPICAISTSRLKPVCTMSSCRAFSISTGSKFRKIAAHAFA